MDSSSNLQLKITALEIIKTFRVPDLQALLDYARLSRSGNKSELFQRCKILISANLSQQLINKINQINLNRINSTRSHHSSIIHPISPSSHNYPNQNAIILPSIDNLPSPNQVQYVPLPFFDKIRTIECINIPVEKKAFSPLRFVLTDYDVDYILNGIGKVFVRIVPTNIHEKQTDVLPPYLFVQCNGQTIINNNVAKTVGSQAHSIAFPTDITDKIIPKSNVHNSLNYFWLQSPINMSFKNLPKSYTLTIQIVRGVSLNSLFETILKREPQLIKKDQNDSDIEIEDLGLMATRCRVSLICPITQSLIVVPTKSSYCSHLTCFDLRPFLQMNERRLQWTCPLCKKPASYDTLHVDKRLQHILSNVPPNCSTVDIDSSTKNLSDCQYILDNVKQEKMDNIVATTSHESDDDDDDDESIHNSPIKSRRQSAASDCIILSSGSESEDENEIEDNHTPISDLPIPITPLSNDLFTQNTDTNDKQINSMNQSPNSVHSVQSLEASNPEDENYWEDIAKFTYDLIENNNYNEENVNRKRSNSSTSSLLSNGDDDHHNRKRTKRYSTNKSQTNDVEVITLSSSDSNDSDNDDQLS